MKRITKIISAILAVLVVTAVFAGCSSSNDNSTANGFRTLDEIKSSGTINIGVFSDKNPFGYVDENGEYQGYDVYFANRLGKDLGVKVNFVSTEAANRIEYLQTGKVDLILANFTVTDERKEEVDFALPYMSVSLGVVSPKSNTITSLDNWNESDSMIVISGTTAETYLTKNYPNIKLQKYDAYAQAKTALENGSGAAWANDNTEVIAYANQNSDFVVGIPELGSADTIAPAVTKGNDTLLNWINDEIKAAMLAKEKVRLTALRAVKSEILLAKTADGSETIADDAVLKIVQKLVKQRRESAAVYTESGRPELAENELAEAAELEGFLPAQMSGVELESALKAIIEQVGAKAPSDMGKVMGVATKQLAGRADGRAISEAVKKLLQQ